METKIKSYKDLDVYNRSYKLSIIVCTKVVVKLPKEEKFDLKDYTYVLKKSWQSQKIFSLMDLEPLFDTFFARWPLGLPVVS